MAPEIAAVLFKRESEGRDEFMAGVDNGYGEGMPDEMTVTLWVDKQGKVQQADSPRGTKWPSDFWAKATTVWTEFSYPDEVWVQPDPVKPETLHTVDKAKQSFTYMDCGRWGGPAALGTQQRGFGVIWGTWAAVCQFVPDSSASTDANYILSNGARATNTINDLIDSLRGPSSSVKLIKSQWSSTPTTMPAIKNLDWDTIYIILPDLHLPISSYMPHSTPVIIDGKEERRLYDSDGKAMGRINYCDKDGIFGDQPDDEGMVEIIKGGMKKMGPKALEWFANYLAGDIFGNPSGTAAKDLIAFMGLIGKSSLSSRIHFVQVGDMYDLWIGLECFYDQMNTQTVQIGDRHGILAANFIGFWVDRTNAWFDPMIKAMTGVSVREKSWLWGNHDNYLAAHTPASISQRIKEIRKGGVYIEHGQRGDSSNRDGETSGHSTTNQVFAHPVLRSFDPDRRDYFTTTAAISYAGKPDFCVYAMGHTHSPFLTRLNVELKRYEYMPKRLID